MNYLIDDLDLHIENVRNSQNTCNIESDTVKLNIYYNRFARHFNNLYDFVRENYSFIIDKQSEQGIDEKKFIDIMGEILSEAANAKDVLEKIIKTK